MLLVLMLLSVSHCSVRGVFWGGGASVVTAVTVVGGA